MGSKLLLSCLWYMKCVKKQNHQLWCHFGPFLLVLCTYKKAEAAAAEAKEREREVLPKQLYLENQPKESWPWIEPY